MRWILLVLPFVVSLRVMAEDIQIFDLRKSLTLSDQEVAYRDYYLSKGYESGLRVGMVVTVKRKQPLYNNIQNRSAGDLNVAVGRVKIIHVESGLAVARDHSQFSRENLPILEDNFIMIGDDIDLSSASMDQESKAGKKEKSSSHNEPTPTLEPKVEARSDVQVEKASQTAQSRQIGIDFGSPNPDNKPINGPTL